MSAVGSDDEDQILHSEGTWTDRDSALEDIKAKQDQYPDAGFAEERTVVERRQIRPAKAENAESTEAAYKRGYEDAKRELLERLQ